MASIFDLNTNPSQLASSNNGTSKMAYQQLTATRDCTRANFPNGQINYRFDLSGNQWWIPSRSYLRMRVSLKNSTGGALTTADGIAPQMDLCAALWNSLEFRIADKTVSRISDFVPQVDALHRRLSSSQSQLNGMYASTNWWDADFKSRMNDIVSDPVGQTTGPPTTTLRVALGFDAVGADNNRISYSSASGVCTLAQGTGGGALPDAGVAFPVGSYIVFSTRPGEPIRVIKAISDTEFGCEPGKPDVTASGTTDFQRLIFPTTYAVQPRNVSSFEMSWQPPLSIFGIQTALPAGRYELVLNPQTESVFRQSAIESLTQKVAGTDFTFEIESLYFMCCQLEGPRVDSSNYLIDLQAIRCQTEDFGTSNNSFTGRAFDVSPSTFALTAAIQDLRCIQDSRFSQTRFRAYNNAGTVEQGLKLNRFFISYDSLQTPSPDADPNFDPTTRTDFTEARYIDTQLYSGAFNDPGGAESLAQFHLRGQYLYFAWPRDGMSRATRAVVYTGFASSAELSNSRLLLFDHHRMVAKVQIADGRVTDVQVEDT